MHMLTKTRPPECADLVYTTINAVKNYLWFALSAKDMMAINKCEISLSFVKDALELVKRLEMCLGHGR
jgi:hypothetical protein